MSNDMETTEGNTDWEQFAKDNWYILVGFGLLVLVSYEQAPGFALFMAAVGAAILYRRHSKAGSNDDTQASGSAPKAKPAPTHASLAEGWMPDGEKQISDFIAPGLLARVNMRIVGVTKADKVNKWLVVIGYTPTSSPHERSMFVLVEPKLITVLPANVPQTPTPEPFPGVQGPLKMNAYFDQVFPR